jgi:hypothetical protein
MSARRLHATLAAVALVAVLARHASAQATTNDFWPMDLSGHCWEESGQAGALAAVLALQQKEEASHETDAVRSLFLHELAAQWALAGEEQRALATSDEATASRRPSPAPEGADPLAALHAVEALPALVGAARDRRLVILNEEIGSSVQHAFTNRLLEPLHELGFRYLAVETLYEDAGRLAERGYPELGDGTSSLRDPASGDLLRRALALGYVVVSYAPMPGELRSLSEDEPWPERQSRRERAQAGRLVARTLGRDPEARVLVVDLRDHLGEAASDGWTPMAAVLRELTGLDPLTVDQIAMTEHSRPELEDWAYRRADAQGWLAGEPALLVDEAGTPWSAAPGDIDISLFHPRTRLEHGRPQWMAMGGLRKPVDVTVLEHDQPLVLVARLQGESAEAVPVDRAIAWPGQPAPSLMLRPGAYVILTLDRSGKELAREDRRVE